MENILYWNYNITIIDPVDFTEEERCGILSARNKEEAEKELNDYYAGVTIIKIENLEPIYVLDFKDMGLI